MTTSQPTAPATVGNAGAMTDTYELTISDNTERSDIFSVLAGYPLEYRKEFELAIVINGEPLLTFHGDHFELHAAPAPLEEMLRRANDYGRLVEENQRQWRAIEKMAAAAGPAYTPRWVLDALPDEDDDG